LENTTLSLATSILGRFLQGAMRPNSRTTAPGGPCLIALLAPDA